MTKTKKKPVEETPAEEKPVINVLDSIEYSVKVFDNGTYQFKYDEDHKAFELICFEIVERRLADIENHQKEIRAALKDMKKNKGKSKEYRELLAKRVDYDRTKSYRQSYDIVRDLKHSLIGNEFRKAKALEEK